MRKLSVTELNRLSMEDYQAAAKRPLVVVLDQVRSLHNVGSVFRTCDAFRVAKVYLCGITPQPPHREIRKTAIGAEESVAWEGRADTGALLDELIAEGYEVLVAEQTDQSVMLPDFRPQPGQAYAVVFGHEIDGVSEAALSRARAALEIPQGGTKHSLNISVAAGIVLYALSMGMAPKP
ncbi:MAG: TrmH family RNA methyltransferase [Bacteroidetes bacterium]|nr:MAG: TrmH family RNA methyltransferase [Bacteroidota bacterium]